MTSQLESLRAALADRYALERELGRGGMATVYLARDLKHGRLVAIKVLRPEIAAALGPERFLREIEIAAGLTHPHMLPLHDSGEADSLVYYVMPFVEGETLRDRLERERQLASEEALAITRDVAEALGHAHAHGIVHRDIKPENVLFEAGHAVVSDFGIARAITAAAGGKLTETGIAIGTPGYMSPEQAMGGERVDGRSDLYSLACMLYEMLAGEPPFTGPSAESVARQHVAAPAPHVSVMRPGVPPAVDQAIARALSKTPADRFATVAEFVRALHGSPDVAAKRPRPRGASRVTWARGAIAVLVIGGTVVYALWGRHKDTVGAEPIGKPKMLAVLPPENLGAPEDEYFADGLSEAINTQLGGIHGLGVIARQSTIGFRKTTKSPQLIGRELGVDYILGGTVRWERSRVAPSRVRVSTALVRASDATQLWARQYDTVVAGVFGVESNLAEKVAGALDVALADPERRALAATPTESQEAHELYLRGRFMVRKGSAPDVRRGLELYREAVAKDSRYAAAWAGIAQAWLSLDVAPRQGFPQARAAALVALKIDSTLAEAHTALGITELIYEWDFAAARRELLRAIALNASDVIAYSAYADLVGVQGHPDSALALLRQARALDPLSPEARLTFARWLVFAGQYDKALQEATSFIDVAPRDAHAMRGYALLGAGRLPEALDEYRMDSVDFMAPVAARLGRPDQARRLVARLIGERRTRYVQADAIAGLYASLGDRDAAFAWLDSAYAERSVNMIFLSLGPILEPIRSDPRFTALKKRVGLP